MAQDDLAGIALIVEEVTPGERIGRINRRVSQFLRGGVSRVWVLMPHEQAVIAYGRRGEIEVIEAADRLPEPERPAGLWLPADKLLRQPESDHYLGNG